MEQIVTGLASKLDSLDLTRSEQAIMQVIPERAAGVDADDVGGFADSFASLLSRVGVKVKVKVPGYYLPDSAGYVPL